MDVRTKVLGAGLFFVLFSTNSFADVTVPTPEPLSNNVPLIALFMLILVFLPVFVGFINSRSTLIFLALVFCVLGVTVGGGGSIFGFAAGGIVGGLVLLPMAAGLWFTGLMFGLAASIDSMAQRREKIRVRSLNKIAKQNAVRSNVEARDISERMPKLRASPTIE